MKNKKLKVFFALGVVAIGISSCTMSHTAVITNNAVGSKIGKASGTIFSPKLDVTYKKAKENGKIRKVGVAEMKVTNYLIIPFYETIVSGE
jgi:hypothetical protein